MALKASSDRAAQALVSAVGPAGVISNGVSGDLACQYKLPTLLLLSGHQAEANSLLDRFKRDFLQTDGDFVSFPGKDGKERKSESFVMTHFWSYMNAWIVTAAHRLGRFDISVPAFQYCKRYYCPRLMACCVTGPLKDDDDDDQALDTLMTAHFGLTCLYMGDIETARGCGEGLLNFVAKQPNMAEEFFMRMSFNGNIVTEAPENMGPFYSIKKSEENQFYFFLGYHAIFMTKLFKATQEPQFLTNAKEVLEFALGCHDSMFRFSLSHKLAYGAALVAEETKDIRFRDLSIRICKYLMSRQGKDGLYCEEMEELDRFDQSAEIAIWLRETGAVMNEE